MIKGTFAMRTCLNILALAGLLMVILALSGCVQMRQKRFREHLSASVLPSSPSQVGSLAIHSTRRDTDISE